MKVDFAFVMRWLEDALDTEQLTCLLADELDRLALVIVTFEDYFLL